jgi:ABC-type nickel/cobalt efflux system permease component RcnA
MRLLLISVAAVGFLHTIVPDHWAPIAVLARQQGWSAARTARAAAIAGLGHVTTTLLLGGLLWIAGATLATRYAHFVSIVSALALIAFGLWIAYGGWQEVRGAHEHGHDHSHLAHGHAHRHPGGAEHVHWHEHNEEDWHVHESGDAAVHVHPHETSGRTALLLILGSSPMVEGIPLFFNASTKGAELLGGMAVVFALSTILTYVAMCVVAARGLAKTSFGPLERYGEVLSGLFVAAVGVYALLTA